MKQNLNLGDNPKVFVDKKTHARTIAIPFRLPDGTSAVCMISRLKNQEWDAKEITSIEINYNEDKTTA